MFAYLLKSYNHTVQGPDRVLCHISYTSYSRYIVHIQEWYESYGRAGLYLGPWKPTGFKAISKRCPCHVGFSCDVFLHVFCCRDKDTFGISQVNQYCIWTSSSLREDMSSTNHLNPPESVPEEHWMWSLNHQTTSQNHQNNASSNLPLQRALKFMSYILHLQWLQKMIGINHPDDKRVKTWLIWCIRYTVPSITPTSQTHEKKHNLDFQVVSMAANMKTFGGGFAYLYMFVVGVMFICWFHLVVVGLTCLYLCFFVKISIWWKNTPLHGGSST